MNRPDLMNLVGKRVKVTSNTGASWSGTLTALCDHPSMIVDHPDGTRMVLPQHLAVAEDTDPETHGMAWLHQCGHLNQGAWNDSSVCGGCRFSVDHAEYVDAHYVLTVVPAVPGKEDR